MENKMKVLSQVDMFLVGKRKFNIIGGGKKMRKKKNEFFFHKAVIDQFIFDSKIALLVNFIIFTRNCVYGSGCLSIVGARNNMLYVDGSK